MSSLSSAQIQQYKDDGYVAPLDVLSKEEALEIREEIELIDALERYRISSITNDWDGTSGTVDDAKYSIQLEEQLGDDVNFMIQWSDDTGSSYETSNYDTMMNYTNSTGSA